MPDLGSLLFWYDSSRRLYSHVMSVPRDGLISESETDGSIGAVSPAPALENLGQFGRLADEMWTSSVLPS